MSDSGADERGRGRDGDPDRPADDGGEGDRGGFRPLGDPRSEAERARTQVQLILDAIPGAAFFPPGDPAATDYLYVEGRLLVRDADLDRVLAVVEGSVEDGGVNGLSAVVLTSLLTPAALERLDARLGEGIATPDHILYVCMVAYCCPADEPTPVDTGRPSPSRLRDVDAGRGVLVHVIDTGLVESLVERHSWLAGVTGEPDAVDPAAIGPYGGHGSFSAGVLRAIAPAAEVVVFDVLNRAGAVTEFDVLRALYRALDDMPDIICMSAGTHTRRNVPPLSFEVFWQERLRHLKGTTLIVAAGNDGDRRAFWPAAFEWTVSVGAVDAEGARAPFSNFGSWVDVYALGVDVVNAYPEGTFTYREPPRAGQSATFPAAMAQWSGTSFATPVFAGQVAVRAGRTGLSGARSARAALRAARAAARPGVGAVADLSQLDGPDPS